MPKKSEKTVERTYTRRQHSRWQEEQRRSRIVTIAVSSIIVVVLILVGVVVADSISDDDSITVLKVNDQSFEMGDYVKMLKLNGIRNSADQDELTEKAQETLDSMKDREIISQLADSLAVKVSDDEIDAKIEEIFPAPEPDEDGNLPEYSDYEIFLKRMDKIGVSKKDFRQAIASDILGQKVDDFIGDRDVPEMFAQAHIQGIMVDTKETVDVQYIVAQIKARMTDGEDFASMAQEFSADPSSRQKGGDLEWIPENISETYAASRYNEGLEEAAFNLDIGTLSNPIALSDSETNTRHWLIEPIERDGARVLDEDMRTILENQAFNDWYTEQRDTFTIEDLLNPDLRNEAIAEALS